MATSSVLYAAGKEIGSTCSSQNREFIACKTRDEDPAACLDKGEAVQTCALKVLKSAMATCDASFKKYASCLDRQISEEYMFERCRSEESAFVQCRSDAQSPTTATAAASISEKEHKTQKQ